ncbi:MAG TPA: ABC transporter permease [Fimbriimonadaceae bacterium]|nr:ABC transporter permease [Fimbriimonadaceae bacterium]HRJ32934.1 ABC transporter permease [Fimbriimonadaceae bacterium]
MTLGDSLQSALRAISANKLRSALTTLGVVIGVGSVIAMLGIGEGTKKKSLENIEAMGTNMITVMPDWRRGSSAGMAGAALKDEDVEVIRRRVPTAKIVAGGVRSQETVKFGNRNTRTQIMGGEPEMAIVRNATRLFQGSWYTQEDEAMMNRKAVLGYQVYDTLFGGENAVGSTIMIKGQPFEVAGVIFYKGGSGFMNPDDQIYIPLSTARQRLMGRTNLDMINVMAINTEVLPFTQTEVEASLALTRRNAAGENQFRVFNQGEWIEQIETQTRLLSFLLAGIASVSLLVGGIGIMNIMLVSVTERTREIGLRKAIGAKRSGILIQFLLESVVMCVLGGGIGVALGYGATVFVAEALKVPPVVQTQAIVMAFGFSAFVGLFFGLYPALRASSLQPIEALRHE